MPKRIFAWILLIGFLVLILNLMFFHQFLEISIVAYIIVAVAFMFYSKLGKPNSNGVEELNLESFIFGYGKGKVSFKIPEKNLLMTVRQNTLEHDLAENLVEKAIKNPIGSPSLDRIVKAGEKIVIVTSDITRPLPSKKVLPILLNELNKAGIPDKDIKVVFALGSHRKHTRDEMIYLVSQEVFDRVTCIDGDPDDCINFGKTSHGTPIDVTRVVAEADRVIALANIEYHYFAGFSGGAKSIMPGVSSRAAIQSNHSAMVQAKACAGLIEGNPVRRDIEEFVETFKIDFIVNVVLDEAKNIVFAVAGHHIEAHRVGCEFLDKMYRVEIPEKADIVITTPGGYPKDINLYQAQKALDNSKNAVRDGGIIILVAACTEGLGEHVFEKWYSEAKAPQDLIKRVQENFELGGHKAAAIALVLERAKVFLVSDMKPDFVRSLFIVPFSSVDEAINEAAKQLGKDSKVLIMPYGGSTLPTI